MGEPVIYIDPDEAQRIEKNLILREIYYRPEGYYRTTKKMQGACKKAGYEFSLTEIKKWLNRQALYQIHKARPKFIQYASFNNIQTLNEVHQSDTTPMPHDKVGNRIYKYRGVIKDIATRYRCSFALTDKSSAQMARAIKKIYNNPNYPLSWPKSLIVDKGTEYMAPLLG